eukprot:g2281.t1
MVDIALVDVTIPSFSQMQDGSGKSYTSYRIEYEDHGAGQESGSATHRYSAFLLLDRQLRRLLHKGIKLPTLPKKRVFGHTDGAVLEYRRSKLEMYLRMLLHTPDVCKNAAAAAKIWDFVRMDDDADETASARSYGSSMASDMSAGEWDGPQLSPRGGDFSASDADTPPTSPRREERPSSGLKSEQDLPPAGVNVRSTVVNSGGKQRQSEVPSPPPRPPSRDIDLGLDSQGVGLVGKDQLKQQHDPDLDQDLDEDYNAGGGPCCSGCTTM